MPSICFAGNYSHFSGALEVFRNIARFLKTQGWQTGYIYHKHRKEDVQPDLSMFDVVEYVNDEQFERERIAEKFAGLANQFDIVHTSLIPIQWRFMFKQFCNRPMVETYHSSDGWNWMKREYMLRLGGNVERLPDATVAISRGLGALIAKDLGTQVEVILNGIEIPDQVYWHNGPYISYCGRIGPDKGLDEWMNIACSLRRQRPDLKFQWIGELSPGHDPYILDAFKAGCPWLEITGFVEDVTPYYAETGCLLHTSPSEGLPMVLVEAHAHGVPSVAYAVGEVRESHAVMAKNRQDAENKVLEVLDTWTEEKAIKCRELMRENFDINAMGRKYLSIYSDLL